MCVKFYVLVLSTMRGKELEGAHLKVVQVASTERHYHVTMPWKLTAHIV